jgi:hypothetical protein
MCFNAPQPRKQGAHVLEQPTSERSHAIEASKRKRKIRSAIRLLGTALLLSVAHSSVVYGQMCSGIGTAYPGPGEDDVMQVQLTNAADGLTYSGQGIRDEVATFINGVDTYQFTAWAWDTSCIAGTYQVTATDYANPLGVQPGTGLSLYHLSNVDIQSWTGGLDGSSYDGSDDSTFGIDGPLPVDGGGPNDCSTEIEADSNCTQLGNGGTYTLHVSPQIETLIIPTFLHTRINSLALWRA